MRFSEEDAGVTAGRAIAVTGATGFVGRYVVRELLSRGHRVKALVRDRAKAESVLPSGVEMVVGDVFSGSSVRSLMDGCWGVVNTIGIRREVPPDVTFARLHVDAMRILMRAASDAGARRWVQVSAIGARPNAPTAYWRTKYEGERLLRASGLEWTILRPSMIHGPDGEFMQMVKGWALGRSAPHFFIPYFTRVEFTPGFPPKPPKFVSARVAPVAVEDVAKAAGESFERETAIGEVYALAGPEEMDWPTMLGHVRDALPLANPKMRIIGLPGVMGLAAAMKAKIFGLSNALPFGPDEPRMAMEDSTASTAKVSSHLGLIPRPFFETVSGYAGRI